RTRPTSLNRIMEPSFCEMMMREKSSTFVNRPIVRSMISEGPAMKVPPGISMFCRSIELRTCSEVSRSAISRSASSSHRICDLSLHRRWIGIRAQFIDAVNRIDVFFDSLRDRTFYLLRAGAGELHLYGDLRLVGLRHQIDAEFTIRKQAEGNESERHHDRKNR